jgi:hypothetical protein
VVDAVEPVVSRLLKTQSKPGAPEYLLCRALNDLLGPCFLSGEPVVEVVLPDVAAVLSVPL